MPEPTEPVALPRFYIDLIQRDLKERGESSWTISVLKVLYGQAVTRRNRRDPNPKDTTTFEEWLDYIVAVTGSFLHYTILNGYEAVVFSLSPIPPTKGKTDVEA